MPFRCLLFSPGLSVADVRCPHCRTHLHAGSKSKRLIWTGLIAGGLLAAVGGVFARHELGWNRVISIGVIFLIAVTVAGMLTGYTWFRNDYYIDKAQ